MRRYAVCGVAAAVLAAMLLVGCSGGTPAEKKATARRETVRISGSGTCIPLIRILTSSYKDPKIEWRFLPGLHSGGGIKGVANGELEIGAVSRELTDEEKALGLKLTPISRDGIVIAVHPSVRITGLTTQQVKDIYSGKIANWKELGGPDMPITVLDRNEDESAKIIMRKYVFGPNLVISPKAVSLFYETDMIDGVRSTPGAIGYFSLGYAVSNQVPVNMLALDGVKPTVANIRNGSYKVIRPLGVVTAPNDGAEIEKFLSWVASPEAVKLIESDGYAAAN